MELYFYNTLTRQKDKFTPLTPGEVKMYTCGPTVYRYVHIGNLRTWLMADLREEGVEPLAFRLLCLGIYYRGHMNATWDSLRAAQSNLDRLRDDLAARGVVVKDGKEGQTWQRMKDKG